MGVRGAGAVAVKVLDGSGRAGTLAALTLLARAGFVDADAVAEVLDATVERVLGGGPASREAPSREWPRRRLRAEVR